MIRTVKIKILEWATALAGMISVGILMQSCSSEMDGAGLTDISGSKFALFEKEFVNSLSSNKNVVKLIGFKTYNISENERQDFKKLVAGYGDEMRKINNIVADDYSFFRIYFPLHTAIIEYEGKSYMADEKGLVYIPDLTDVSKITVVGRKKSEKIQGTGSNIIKKDMISFENPFKQKMENGIQSGYSIEGNACVFDLDALAGMNESCCKETLCKIPRLKSGTEADDNGDDGDDSLDENGRVSCVQNHGGITCSEAFGIHGGGCTYIPGVCMDYNGGGPFGSCSNGSIIDFVGSDCGIAVSRGECWNEI
jgi:hypothetical protein